MLELNTSYAYLLLCTHFAGTSIVAEQGGRLIGVVCAYRPPIRPRSLFVWQVGVHPDARGRGLGGRMFDGLVARESLADVDTLEATVASSNEASRRLFEGWARRRGVAFRYEPAFEVHHFPGGGHEAEPLISIGPLPRRATERSSA